MGCISSDELLYYLEEQLEIYFDEKGSRIKRIIFDDLQKVDFCFPLLKDNGLFFADLKSFCQKISAYMPKKLMKLELESIICQNS